MFCQADLIVEQSSLLPTVMRGLHSLQYEGFFIRAQLVHEIFSFCSA
jgi:hypothetical protein